MPIHYVCEPKLNRPVESERSSPTEFKLQSYVLWTLTLEKRHHPPPAPSRVEPPSDYAFQGGGEIGFVLFIYPQSTRELRALICISKGGGTGEGGIRQGAVRLVSRASTAPGRGSSSTFLFIRVKQIKVVAAVRRNGSNMLNRTKIYIHIYVYVYIIISDGVASAALHKIKT